MKKKLCAVMLFAVIALSASVSAVRVAAADMLLMPVRIYFTDGERMQALTVLNSDDAPALFRISMQHKKQLPDGGYLNLTEPLMPGYDPSTWLVYSPRQVSLEPQGKQSIRLSLRRPADMPDGEYRVHLALDRYGRSTMERESSDKIAAKMMVNVGFAVPVVIRKGKNDTTAQIASYKILAPDAKSGETKSRLMIDINRRGKYSSVGELLAYWTPKGGDEALVGKQKGIIIYPENENRTARVYLDTPISGGRLRVVYQGIEVDSGRVFDERSYDIP